MLRRQTLAAALVLAAAPAFGQAWPTKPITMIVPFAAGGPTDLLARIIGERMGKELGQQFIIENVTGAAGTIAMAKLARAAPDGYTIGIGAFVLQAGNLMQTDQLLAGVVILSLFGLAVGRLINLLETRLLHWR